MPPQDPTRRLVNELRTISLDLSGRMASIMAAMKLKPALFDRDKVLAVRDFAREGQLQRGGSAASPYCNSGPEQIAEELNVSIARIDGLTNKLRRGRFSRDALLLAGLSIRAACTE